MMLECCEEMANLLESGQLVPMQIPPTARVEAFRRNKEARLLEIKQFAYELAGELKKGCQIL